MNKILLISDSFKRLCCHKIIQRLGTGAINITQAARRIKIFLNFENVNKEINKKHEIIKYIYIYYVAVKTFGCQNLYTRKLGV